jgi:hypothetical protein
MDKQIPPELLASENFNKTTTLIQNALCKAITGMITT